MPAERIVMYGTTWCPDCKRAKRFLGQQRVPDTHLAMALDLLAREPELHRLYGEYYAYEFFVARRDPTHTAEGMA